MRSSPTIDWSAAKEIDLEELFQKEIGPPVQGTPGRSRNLFWYCPFHKDSKTPSFTVVPGTNTWKCHGCGQHGDIFDFFKLKFGWSHLETLEHVTNQDIPRIETRKKEHIYREWNLEEVAQRTAALQERAVGYFEKRGVSGETVKRFHIGGETWHWTPTVGTWRWNGYVTRPHFTIPNFWGNTVKAVKCRRDDEQCKQSLVDGTIDDDLFSTVLEKLTERYGKDVDENMIVESIFGPRFISWRNGNGHWPYNLRIVAQQNGSGIEPRKLSYILITEAEIDALYLRDIYGDRGGYPAVAMKPRSGLDVQEIFSGVSRVLIIADNDDAGKRNAEALANEIGRGRIINPPVGKDTNDVPKELLTLWLSKLGLNPIPRKYL